MTYKFTVSNKTFTIIELTDLDVKTNTGNNQQDYVVVLSSGGPVILDDRVSSSDVLGSGEHLWYEFKKEPMVEETYPPYLAEKLALEFPDAIQFIRAFNSYIGRIQNDNA
jgi:hypothetical protein